jgi:hypothetical protein
LTSILLYYFETKPDSCLINIKKEKGDGKELAGGAG